MRVEIFALNAQIYLAELNQAIDTGGRYFSGKNRNFHVRQQINLTGIVRSFIVAMTSDKQAFLPGASYLLATR